MMLRVDEPNGRLLFGGTELPGVFQSLTLNHEAKMDERQRPNRSGVSKRPKGLGDAEVKLQLAFPGSEDQTCYEQLGAVTGRFRALDRKGQPPIVSLIHPHVQAYGFSRVRFSKVGSAEKNDTGVLFASLEFVQHRPMPPHRRKESLKDLERTLLRGEIVLDRWARTAQEIAGIVGPATVDAFTKPRDEKSAKLMGEMADDLKSVGTWDAREYVPANDDDSPSERARYNRTSDNGGGWVADPLPSDDEDP